MFWLPLDVYVYLSSVVWSDGTVFLVSNLGDVSLSCSFFHVSLECHLVWASIRCE